jgi:hypothetical protein
MPFTARAHNPDVRADSNHLPFIAAAGVLLFQPDHITKINFQHLLFHHLSFLRRVETVVEILNEVNVQESRLFGWIPTFVGMEL